MPIYNNGKDKKYYALQPLAKNGSPREKFDALYAQANAAHPRLHDITREIARKYGGQILMAPLKQREVAWGKLSRGDANKVVADAEIAKLNDIVRATVKFATFAALIKAQRHMDKNYEGIIYDRYKDGATESGYRDVKYVLKVTVPSQGGPTHHICELQFHTVQSRDAYEVFHPIYEVLRRMGKEGAAQPITIKAADAADLGPKLRQTWSTMLLRHIGGQDIVHSFYDIVRLFYMDPPLETPREGEVELSKADVESLIELGPIIHEAYYRNMKNARVMVDGKLQPVIDGQARKAIYSNQKIAAKQAAMKDVVQSKVYI
jgi:hypothetical protein